MTVTIVFILTCLIVL